MKTSRIIPKDKIEGLRFGQLLINALCTSGHLEQIDLLASNDVNEEEYYLGGVAYAVAGKDLFYLENDELEEIIQNFLSEE